jgi:hypothetical protein
MEMIMIAGMVTASNDAYRTGLVNHVVSTSRTEFCNGVAQKNEKLSFSDQQSNQIN